MKPKRKAHQHSIDNNVGHLAIFCGASEDPPRISANSGEQRLLCRVEKKTAAPGGYA